MPQTVVSSDRLSIFFFKSRL